MIDPNCHASRHTDPAPVKHVRGMTTLGHYAASPMQVSTRQHHHIQLACYGRVCGELPALTPQGAEQSVYLCAGQLVADTAAAAGVKVFVFSTLEDVEKRSKVRSSELHKTTEVTLTLHRCEEERVASCRADRLAVPTSVRAPLVGH